MIDSRATLKLFAKKEDDPDWYNVVINNATRFELAMDLVSPGCHSVRRQLQCKLSRIV